MNNINGYTFFRNYYDSLNDLSLEDKKELLVAINDFVFEDIEPIFDGFKNIIWKLIKPNLVSSKNKSSNYQTKTKKKSKKTKLKSNENQNETNDLLENKNIEENKNKKKNKEIEKEMNKEDVVSTTTTNIYTFLESCYGRTISSLEFEKIDLWVKEFNEDIVRYAIELSVLNNTKKFNYVEGILRNWKACGYRTLTEIKDSEAETYSARSERPTRSLEEIFDYNWLEDNDD